MLVRTLRQLLRSLRLAARSGLFVRVATITARSGWSVRRVAGRIFRIQEITELFEVLELIITWPRTFQTRKLFEPLMVRRVLGRSMK